MEKAALTNRLIGGLEVVEHALKGQRDALCRVFVFRRNLVNSLNDVSEQDGPGERVTQYLSEVMGAEERLQQGVHVTCGALVFQSDIARFLL